MGTAAGRPGARESKASWLIRGEARDKENFDDDDDGEIKGGCEREGGRRLWREWRLMATSSERAGERPQQWSQAQGERRRPRR